MKMERRGFDLKEIRLQETEEGESVVEGSGIVFNSMSEDLGGFREVIKPKAVEGVLNDDVRALFNHDKNIVLGRTKSGTLELSVDGDGLNYRIKMPNTTAGKDVAETIRRGDIDGSSFGFRVAKGGDKWEQREDGTVVRTVTKLERLFDVSPVTFPAYPDTDVAKREYRSFMESKEEEQEPDYSELESSLRAHDIQFLEERQGVLTSGL